MMEMDGKGIGIGDLEKRFRRANGEAKKFWEAYRQAAEYAAPQINDFDDTLGVTKQPRVNNSQVFMARCHPWA